MKKKHRVKPIARRLLVGLFLLAAMHVNAGGIPFGELDGYFTPRWTPLQLTLAPTQSLVQSGVPVYGFCGGITLTIQDQVWGLNLATFATMTRQQGGITAAMFNFFMENYGVACGAVNFCHGDFSGVSFGVFNRIQRNAATGISIGAVNSGGGGIQFGVVNLARHGWQFGLINYNPNAALPCTILFNYAATSPD